MPLAFVMIGERFGILPWHLEREPLDQVEFYLSVMAAEGAAHALVDDLGPDETLELD